MSNMDFTNACCFNNIGPCRYTHFSFYYPARGNGQSVLETKINKSLLLPAAVSPCIQVAVLENDQVFDNSKVRQIYINIRELCKSSQGYSQDPSSIVYEAMENAARHANDTRIDANESNLSFNFIFYVEASDLVVSDSLFKTRLYLFSKIHDWQPGSGRAGIEDCVVQPLNFGFDCPRFDIESASRLWKRKLGIVLFGETDDLEEEPNDFASDHQLFGVEALSSDLGLVQRLQRFSPRTANARPKRLSYPSVGPSQQYSDARTSTSPSSESIEQTFSSLSEDEDTSDDGVGSSRSECSGTEPFPNMCSCLDYLMYYPELMESWDCLPNPGASDDPIAPQYLDESLFAALDS